MTCRGFRFGAAACGIKASGALDVGVLASDRAAAAAAVFTKNRFAAAPVRLSRALLRKASGRARGCVVNSGNANACTRDGARDARDMARAAGEALGAPAENMLVASTGVIGVPLPMERVRAGIAAAAADADAGGFPRFAEAILTTDAATKTARRTIRLGGSKVTLLACTKGAGMIAPNMATTLSFVVTDARVAPAALDRALREATDATFNAITVDGDTSTNDMILAMASGAAGHPSARGRELARFAGALHELLDELAGALMTGGEGVHHVVTVRVRGARTANQARKIARAIANSPLVKTAIAGCDPNWGRVLSAAGNAGVPLRADRVTLDIGGVRVVEGGVAVPRDVEARATRAMNEARYELLLDLGAGDAEARFLACDLSHDYVSINADYRT